MGLLRSLALWLGCGVALTVATSWACALRCSQASDCEFDLMALSGWEQRRMWTRAPEGWERSWGREVPADWPLPSYHYEFDNPGMSIDATLTYYPGCKTGFGHAIGIVRSGWPLRSMEWELIQEDPAPLTPTGLPGFGTTMPRGFLPENLWRAGLPLPKADDLIDSARYQGKWVRLPLRPVLAGFAADTGLFSAALWTVLVGPGTLRRAIRRRRGRCTACGYDLVGLTSCPECGRVGTSPLT